MHVLFRPRLIYYCLERARDLPLCRPCGVTRLRHCVTALWTNSSGSQLSQLPPVPQVVLSSLHFLFCQHCAQYIFDVGKCVLN